MEYGLYRIGQISKMFDLPVETLRYYDKIGLFAPEYTSKETKYRYYSWYQFERLRLILFLRNLGFSLKEISTQIGTGTGAQYTEAIRIHCGMIDQRIQELTVLKRFMENRLREIERARNAPHNQVLFEHFPEQRVCLFNRVIESREEYERAVLDFQRKDNLQPGNGRFGQVFSLEKIMQQRDDACDGIYLAEEALTEEFLTPSRDALHCFPAGLYAVLYYSKPTEDSHPFWTAMLNEIEKRSYEPLGDVIRIIVFEKGGNIEREDYLVCMRVLVRKKVLPDIR